MAERRIKKNGFTLIELLVGIVIIFIIGWVIFVPIAAMFFGGSTTSKVEVITQEQDAAMNKSRQGPIYD